MIGIAELEFDDYKTFKNWLITASAPGRCFSFSRIRLQFGAIGREDPGNVS